MSYWDWLPPEIQEYILTFADSQALIEHHQSWLSQEMCDKIINYSILRLLWSHGHLQLRPLCKKEESGFKCEHLGIYGECKHSNGEKRTFLLGLGYPQAFEYCNNLIIREMFGVPVEVIVLSRAPFH